MEPVNYFVKIALLAILPGLILESKASSSATPIQTVAADLDYAIEVFLEANDGILPNSWDDVDRFLLSREKDESAGISQSRLFRNIEDILGGSLQSQFPLFTQKGINIEGAKNSQFRSSGKLVAVVAGTVIEGRRDTPGRYALILTEANEVKYGWIDELHIQDQFSKAGETLPAGSPRVQPETFDEELDRLGREFAEKNFADPQNPTELEVEAMKVHFSEIASVQSENATAPDTSEARQNASIPKKVDDQIANAKSAGSDESPPQSPVWAYVLVAVAILGIVVLLLRARKGNAPR